ncbi:MAG: ChrR family anti-sigma-E factor [Rhodospirillaceae bacterium]
MISHHPSGDLLLSYSAGSLGESWSLAVATHLAFCPPCREEAATADELGGALLQTEGVCDVPASVLDDLLSKVDQHLDTDELLVADQPLAQAEVPSPLRNYVGDTFRGIPWSTLGGGAFQCLIDTGDSGQARLLKIPAGCAVPEHGHGGRELTLVLSGSFSDQTGTFGPGDLEDADEALTHQPLAGREAACICLAVTDAPLQFNSWLPRLLQPLFKI